MSQMFVQCPMGGRCPSVGKAHRPGSKRLKEHQRLAESIAASGNVGPDAEVSPPQVSSSTTSSKFDEAMDFADRHDVTVSATGDLHRGDNGAYLNTSFYRRHGGLNMDDEGEYTSEVIVRARDMANTTPVDLVGMSRDMTNKAYGERATEAIERSDARVRQAIGMASLLNDYKGDYPGARTVSDMKEIGLDRGSMDDRAEYASDLVEWHGISVETSKMDYDGDDFDFGSSAEGGYSRYVGDAVLVNRRGQRVAVNYRKFVQPGQGPGEIKAEDVVQSALMDMSLVESSYQSVKKAESPNGQAPEFPGFSTGVADHADGGIHGVDTAAARSYMYNTVAALDETRYAAREFFGMND